MNLPRDRTLWTRKQLRQWSALERRKKELTGWESGKYKGFPLSLGQTVDDKVRIARRDIANLERKLLA